MSIFKSLNREQKEAVGLLQIGTFLEYFDLMLYVHMAVLLNEIFFPKTDPHTAALLSSFAFCSAFIFRPFGALLFGYIGDRIGRKTTVIITTMMMATSCIIMANLPTYAQIGISAAWIVTICRAIQGISSMGEIMGALVYITEITKPPARYPAVSLINFASALGGVAALGVATLVTTIDFNWRIAFWIGAAIAVVGSIARTRLRETPEFVENILKLKLKKKNNLDNNIEKIEKDESIQNKKTDEKTLLAFFFIYCGTPVCFYILFIYFNQDLINKYGFSTSDIIYNNFLLSIIDISLISVLIFLSYRIHPLKILKIRATLFMLFSISLPFLILNTTNHYQIFVIQLLVIATSLDAYLADGVFIKHISVLKRMTVSTVVFALSRSLMFVITSFGLVYLTEIFGYYGLWIIMFPVTFGFLWGVKHFEVLEGIREPQKPPAFESKHVNLTQESQEKPHKIEDKKIA